MWPWKLSSHGNLDDDNGANDDRGSSPSSVPRKKKNLAISIPKKIGIQISNFSSGAPA
jgi:hypothetical protein